MVYMTCTQSNPAIQRMRAIAVISGHLDLVLLTPCGLVSVISPFTVMSTEPSAIALSCYCRPFPAGTNKNIPKLQKTLSVCCVLS